MNHFEGKSVLEHLKAARAKGALATAEIHGAETPGYLSAGADAARDSAASLLLIWIIFPSQSSLFYLFMIGLLIWKAGRSALLGWARLERLHRLIEEERWEIEHHREQEKQELTEMYRAKGLQGKLLEETIATLMADDNRLLRVMLEEELGLALEAYEHPLKQSFGAAIGVIFSCLLFLIGLYLSPWPFSLLSIAIASFLIAKIEQNRKIEAIIWNLAVVLLAAGAVYFLKELL
jgi:hypothetical protein